jgi:arylsulfatase A-like enzyme/Flp pilus assembly protein TadD
VAVALCAAAWTCRGARSVAPAREAPRNVFLITIDTLRADAVGAYGNRRAATPWIDQLAARGVRFDRARAHAVLTLPSHASILSGLYPPDHGVRDNAGLRFPAAPATLATILKSRGYATGAFISAFPLDSRFGLARGFDEYDDAFVDRTPSSPLLEQERPGTETVSRARRWLDAHAAGPAFLWVHLFEPHAPYAPPEPFASRFRADPYAGDVGAADAALEPLLAPLLAPGGRSNTLVVLTADHGESLGEHGEETHGVFAYESTLRVPLILYAPSLFAPRVVTSEAGHVDILPTIVDALGLPVPPNLRGRTLVAAASGREEDMPSPTYFESLSPALNRGWAPLRGVVHRGLKYIDLPIPELYDLTVDPAETRNVIDDRAADVAELRQPLATFKADRADGTRTPESAEARARLGSLGYASAGSLLRDQYTEDDDPKRLVGVDARLQDAVRLHLAGDRSQALDVAASLVRERPGMRVAWMTLAQIQRDAGQLEPAIVSMRRAHALAPADPQTTALLGAYLTERGDPSGAIAILAPVAAAVDPDPQVLLALALAQARTGRSDDAVRSIERARAADPGNAMFLVQLGTVQLMANRRDAARRAFEAALAADRGLARAHSSLAAMHAEDGRDADAVAAWREATRIDPGEYRRIFLLGLALAKAQRAGPARTCLAFFAANAPASAYGREISTARAWLAAH